MQVKLDQEWKKTRLRLSYVPISQNLWKHLVWYIIKYLWQKTIQNLTWAPQQTHITVSHCESSTSTLNIKIVSKHIYVGYMGTHEKLLKQSWMIPIYKAKLSCIGINRFKRKHKTCSTHFSVKEFFFRTRPLI